MNLDVTIERLLEGEAAPLFTRHRTTRHHNIAVTLWRVRLWIGWPRTTP